jgi:phosphotransferase system HPr-like phosphotransfer protein
MSVTVKVKTDDSTMIAKNLKEVVTTKHHNGKIITLTIDTNGINIDIVNENGLSVRR